MAGSATVVLRHISPWHAEIAEPLRVKARLAIGIMAVRYYQMLKAGTLYCRPDSFASQPRASSAFGVALRYLSHHPPPERIRDGLNSSAKSVL